MIIPYGALANGFSLTAEVREVAAYYGVSGKRLRWKTGAPSSTYALARHALYWKLTTQRRLSAARVAALLNCSATRVRDGARKHAERIREFQLTMNITAKGGK